MAFYLSTTTTQCHNYILTKANGLFVWTQCKWSMVEFKIKEAGIQICNWVLMSIWELLTVWSVWKCETVVYFHWFEVVT